MAEPFVSLVYESTAVTDLIQEISRRSGDLYAPMTSIGELLLLQTDRHFEEERSPEGEPWRPLSAYTLRLKRENRRILNILQSTGRLRGSIGYQADGSSVTIGTNLTYAPDHQLGLGVPARPFLGISDGDEQLIVEILEDHLFNL